MELFNCRLITLETVSRFW